MRGDDVRVAAAAATELLGRVGDPAAPVLDTDVAGVTGHVTTCLLWYAFFNDTATTETSALTVTARRDTGPEHRLRALGAAAEVLARTLDGARPQDRGWHEWGLPDTSGFAAMGCAELLVHTGDVAAAVGLDWTPPPDVVGALVARLFPWVDPADVDPTVPDTGAWAALQWATGRGSLPGRDAVQGWRYHLAPLAEWDGRRPG